MRTALCSESRDFVPSSDTLIRECRGPRSPTSRLSPRPPAGRWARTCPQRCARTCVHVYVLAGKHESYSTQSAEKNLPRVLSKPLPSQICPPWKSCDTPHTQGKTPACAHARRPSCLHGHHSDVLGLSTPSPRKKTTRQPSSQPPAPYLSRAGIEGKSPSRSSASRSLPVAHVTFPPSRLIQAGPSVSPLVQTRPGLERSPPMSPPHSFMGTSNKFLSLLCGFSKSRSLICIFLIVYIKLYLVSPTHTHTHTQVSLPE